MTLCKSCNLRETMPIPLKDLHSIECIMAKSPSETPTYFFPTEPGSYCYYCLGIMSGRITKLDSNIKIKEGRAT